MTTKIPREMNSKIVKLPPNIAGTDFVVGDLHGCRHLLDAKLQEYGFNPAIDRVLSVGDLIDRGPDSWNTLRLIEESWFHFVLGNHEEMLLDLLADRTDRPLPVHSQIYSDPHVLQRMAQWLADQYRSPQHST